jgi:hypothetical protein
MREDAMAIVTLTDQKRELLQQHFLTKAEAKQAAARDNHNRLAFASR